MFIQMFKKNYFLAALVFATAVSLILSIYYLAEDFFVYEDFEDSTIRVLIDTFIDIVPRFAIIALLIITYKKHNPKFLFAAAALFIVITVFYNYSAFYIGYIVLCLFAYFSMRDEKKDLLLPSLSILYLITFFSSVIQYINDVIPSAKNEVVEYPAVNKQFYMIALFLLAVAVVLAVWGAKTDRRFFVKAAAAAYFVGLFSVKFLAVPPAYLETSIVIGTLIVCLASPEFLLSLYLLFKKTDPNRLLEASQSNNERKL